MFGPPLYCSPANKANKALCLISFYILFLSTDRKILSKKKKKINRNPMETMMEKGQWATVSYETCMLFWKFWQTHLKINNLYEY